MKTINMTRLPELATMTVAELIKPTRPGDSILLVLQGVRS